MSRRTERAAERAAEAASEAARVLQARGQEKVENEPAPEPKAEAPEPKQTERPEIPEGRLEKLRNANPRHLAMDELIRKREGHDEPVEAPQEEPKAEATQTPEAAPEAPQAPQEPVAEAPKTVRVKVDGEEFDVPAEEVEEAGGIKAYQKDKASENRLRKANEALAESKRLADLVLRQATPQAPAKPQESDEAFIASKMDIIRFGSPEDAAKAQIEIMQRVAKPVDQNALVQQATAQWRHDQAVAAFDKEFQDIASNPIRLKTVIALRNERVERHRIEKPNQPIDWDSFYRTIGNEVRSAFGGHHQSTSTTAATPSTTSQASDKEARKSSIVNLPTAAARAELPKEEKTLTPAEERQQILAEMKKSRGQLVG